MRTIKTLCLIGLTSFASCAASRHVSMSAAGREPATIDSTVYELVWSDEFDVDGKPDSRNWSYETGFVRNHELQYYQPSNAMVKGGLLVIEGRRENVKNQAYQPGSGDWRKNREYAEYSSASINTRGKREFLYGIFEVRARIDPAKGMWPAIWTLGVSGDWPANGEIDIMEYYRINGEPLILANAAWLHPKGGVMWDEAKIPFADFQAKDPEWAQKFHIWKMDWTEDYSRIYLDGELLNEIDLKQAKNPDGYHPFRQPHYILLNLALGSNGGDPSDTEFPRKYEVDYVRVYQREGESKRIETTDLNR